jgi:hypothetical protein
MSFYNKYLKYKNKYLLLRKQKYSQIGGAKPDISVLKNLSLFEKNSYIDSYLNPLWGFLWVETGAIENYYNFKIDDPICLLVKKVFKDIGGEIFPTNDLINENISTNSTNKNVSIDDFAKLLSHLYLSTFIKSDDKTNAAKIIDKTNASIKLIKDYAKLKDIPKNYKKICDTKKAINKNYDNDFKDFRLNLDMVSNPFLAIKLNIPPKNPENKYADLLYVLQDYVKELEKITTVPKFTSNIKEYFTDTLIKSPGRRVFCVILSALWWNFSNKSDIEQYYRSLNKYLLNTMTITIPEDYSTTLYTKDELFEPSNNFEHALASTYYFYVESVKLFNQDTVTYNNDICKKETCPKQDNKNICDYPDCGESTLRTFINLIIYDDVTQTFDLTKLDRFGAIEDLKEYYRVFNTISSQTNKEPVSIFGKQMTARNAWSKIVSNLENVIYVKKCELKDNDSHYHYEINGGLSKIGTVNMLEVIKQLFKNIIDLSDFGIVITNDINEEGIGTLSFTTSIDNNYIMHLKKQHFAIKEDKKGRKIIINNLTELEQNYQQILTKDIYNVLRLLKKYHTNKQYINQLIYYIKFDLSTLVHSFNQYGIDFDVQIYNAIFDYMYENPNYNAVKHHTLVILSHIKNTYNYDMSPYNYDIEYSPDKKMISLEIKEQESQYVQHKYSIIKSFISKFIYLEKLIFCNNFNLPLDDSLKTLINLQTLTFGNEFNQQFGDSLINLTNLHTLTIGNNFNQPFEDSIKTLINLHTLTLGEKFNQPFGNSLANLTNLQTLTIGRNFNQSLGDSFINLTNLQTLTFGFHFNQPLGDSFINLTNLQTLTFDFYFNQPLGSSFINLTDLRTLTFGNRFNKLLGDSFINLTNLQTLTFGEYFNQPFGDSFINLANLRTLAFGSFFNQPLGGSFVNLANLQTLTFGYHFNQPLGDSFINLTNLQTLTLGFHFNQPLGDSFINLTNLQTLTLGFTFNQPLGDSFINLANLQTLTLGNEFNQSLGNSFINLTDLRTLTFGGKFNKLLGDSFINLTNLQTLTLGNEFNQPLGNSFINLTNLHSLTLGNKFNQPLGNSFINLTNLHSLTFGQNFGVDLDSLEDSLITLTNLKNLTIKDNDLIKKSLEELRRINPTLTIHLLK